MVRSMKKIILFIMIFCFTSTVYAKDLSNQDALINYSLSERIEEENEEDKSGALQYFILIVAFLGISAFFLMLKDNDD